MTTLPNVAARCPVCGRISADNRRHCKPGDLPNTTAWWAEHCRTYICTGCNTTYASHGHYRAPRKDAS